MAKSDNNGRGKNRARCRLLYKNDYVIGKYISIKKEIADTKESYYQALSLSDDRWRIAENDPKPFIKYMLGIILKCYRKFEQRLTISEKSGAKSTAYDIVKNFALDTIGTFTKRDVMESCPSLGSSSVELALKKLVEDKTIKRIGKGRASKYVRFDAC